MNKIKTFKFKSWVDLDATDKKYGCVQDCDIGEYSAYLYLNFGHDEDEAEYDYIHIVVFPKASYGGEEIFTWKMPVSYITAEAIYQEAINKANAAWKDYVLETFFEV